MNQRCRFSESNYVGRYIRRSATGVWKYGNIICLKIIVYFEELRSIMKYYGRSYNDIKSIDKNGIYFSDGDKILFAACIEQRYNSKTCVAERDMFASPAYFEFFTPDKPTRIVFDKKGSFSKHINRKHFLELQMQINNAGYSSYDLS